MKQNIKLFLVALILGFGLNYIYGEKLNNSITSLAKEATVTYFSIGSYNTFEKASAKKKDYENAIVYQDNGVYKVIIGVYGSNDSVTLMNSYFNDLGIYPEKNMTKVNSEFLKLSSSYELLIRTSDETYYNNLNNSLLKLFLEYQKQA